MKMNWLCIIVAIFLSFTHSAQAEKLLILGERGEIFFWDSDDTLESLKKMTDIEFHQYVQDAYFDRSSSALFVTTDTLRAYTVSFRPKSPRYSPINTEGSRVSHIIYDTKTQQPAWVQDRSFSSMVSKDLSGTVTPVTQEQLICPNIKISRTFIPGGMKTTQEFLFQYPELEKLLDRYSSDTWAIIGRSRHFVVYGRVLINSTHDGEAFLATLLIYDHVANVWRVFPFDEYADAFVYDDVIVMQGFFDIKGDLDTIGNQIQRQASGHWYFLLPKNTHLISASLAPSMEIGYATAETAYIVRGQDIYYAQISSAGLSAPEKLVTMPETIKIFGVYPLQSDVDGSLQK